MNVLSASLPPAAYHVKHYHHKWQGSPTLSIWCQSVQQVNIWNVYEVNIVSEMIEYTHHITTDFVTVSFTNLRFAASTDRIAVDHTTPSFNVPVNINEHMVS